MSTSSSPGPFVALDDGAFAKKPFADLRPDDKVVFGNPFHEQEAMQLQASFEAEIAAAGGLDAWRQARDGK